ncbi:MAG: TonB-dependent receptor plug domain-containing protein [Opitutaceae bacterium]|nr:TonB-dependent receptor plug domain-containing protein [Opitutaceae bacterium]
MTAPQPYLPPGARLAACVLLPVLTAAAQTTPAPATPPASDEAITLSPYTVNSDDDRGYYSPAAVSGTRTKTELINLPMNLSVLNEEFIKDIGAIDLVDVVTYSAGAVSAPATSGDTASGDTTGFTVRGFGTHVPYRNGFRRLRVVDTSNISRVEVIKGPASVLYGTAFAGGSINYITKRPIHKRVNDVTLRVGSDDLYRVETDFNVPIVKNKLALRLVGTVEDSDSFTARMHTDLMLINPSLTYWFRPDSSITVEYELTKKNINGFRSGLPYHPLMNFEAMGFPIDRSWNTHAEGDYLDVTMKVLTAEWVHRFNPHFTARANYTREIWTDYTRRNGDSIGLVTASAYAASPWLQPVRLTSRQLNGFSERGSWDDYYQGELVNHFTVKGVEVQTIVGVQRSVEEFRQVFATTGPGVNGGTVNGAPRRALVQWQLYDPATWVITEETEKDVLGFATNTGSMARSQFDTLYLTNQLAFLGGRLRTLAGYRFDRFESYSRSGPLAPTFTESRSSLPTYKTPQFGILYKPVNQVSLFAQYSESVVNLFTSQQRREDGSFFTPTPGRGEGYDIGAKADLFDGRVAGTFSLFKIDNANIVRILASRTDPQNPSATFSPADQGGVQRSEGFDIDLRIRPRKGTQAIFAYAYIDATVLEATDSITLNGQPVLTRKGHQLANSAVHTTSLWVRQDLGNFGRFRNAYVGAGVRYVGDRPTSDTYQVQGYTSVTGASVSNGSFTGGALVKPWTLDAYTVVDFSAGGEFTLGKTRYRTSLSVKNVTDDTYLLQRYHFGAPRSFELRVAMSF